MDKDYLEKVSRICKDVCDEQNLVLVSCKEHQDPELGCMLTVLIDRDFDITLEEIEKFTDTVNPLIDSLGEPEQAYTLDVGSGGSEREIEFNSLNKFISSWLDVKLKKSGEIKTLMLDSKNDDIVSLHHYIKGKKTKVDLKEDDIDSIHMGYKA